MTFTARGYELAPHPDCENWIGGQWRPARSGETLSVENPRHAREMARVAMSGEADVEDAVAAALAALPAWRATPIKERAQVMFRLKALIERDLDELSWIASHETGKVIADARGDVLKGLECVEFGAALPNLVAGGDLEVSRGIDCRVIHEPLGVCAGITPFNFSAMIPLWMLPQVLVGGNTFILKPSEQAPCGPRKLALLLAEAGLPPGVLSLVNGGRAAVEAIVDHPAIQAVAFVGSTKVARALYGRGAATGKRVLCLGSAENHALIAPDAEVELTASTVVASAFGCAGQRCMALSVAVAIGEAQRVVDAIAEHARRIRLGEDMGCLISRESVARIHRYIDAAEAAGAKVLVDGRGATVPGSPGHWIGPTVLDHVTPGTPCGCDEIFGPVLSIVRVPTLEAALRLQSASRYGNGASVFTSSGAVARHVAARLEAGMVGVNVGVPVPREPFGFGGWKDSKFGHGDVTGIDGFHFWTRPRKVTTKWAMSPDAGWIS